MRGRSSVDFIKRFDAEKFPVKIAAETKAFRPPDNLASQYELGACTQYAVRASDEAVYDSR